MSSREGFEKVFPVPGAAEWSDEHCAYLRKGKILISAYNDKWEAWQAATSRQQERIRELEEALKDLLAYVEDGWGDTESLEGARAHKALSATAQGESCKS